MIGLVRAEEPTVTPGIWELLTVWILAVNEEVERPTLADRFADFRCHVREAVISNRGPLNVRRVSVLEEYGRE